MTLSKKGNNHYLHLNEKVLLLSISYQIKKKTSLKCYDFQAR